jgi:polyisoprenoid-binding protein YceI
MKSPLLRRTNGRMHPVTLRFLLLLALVSLPAMHVRAAEAVLSPTGTDVEIRAYKLGLLPVDGKFTRFHGVFRYDPAKPGACQVMLEIETESLAMSDGAVRPIVLGPDFLDAAHFPDMAFDGGCDGNGISGGLRLHGQTHPLRLEVDQSDGSLIATGRLKRAEWGITAQPFRVGATIRIRVRLPAGIGLAGKPA